MGVWTARGITWTTTAGNKTVTATPAVGDLIVIFVGITGTGLGNLDNISDNNSSGTYYTATAASHLTGADQGFVLVRDQPITSATSTIFTATISGDNGGGLAVFSLSGCPYVGSAAVKATGTQSGQAAGTPSITLSKAPGVMDAMFGVVMTLTNGSANSAPPTSWTEQYDQGYNTPASGIEVVFRNSGHTSTTVAWTAATPSEFESHAVAFNMDMPVVHPYPQLLAH